MNPMYKVLISGGRNTHHPTSSYHEALHMSTRLHGRTALASIPHHSWCNRLSVLLLLQAHPLLQNDRMVPNLPV
jgi:hypothetical protein